MSEPTYFDRDGKPIPWEEHRRLRMHETYRFVERTEIGSNVLVSTVWLGEAIGERGGLPLIFETLIVVDGHEPEIVRNATEAGAQAAHRNIVGDFRAALDLATLRTIPNAPGS